MTTGQFHYKAQLRLWHSVIDGDDIVYYPAFNLDLLEHPAIRDCIVLTALSPREYRYQPHDDFHNTGLDGLNINTPEPYRVENALDTLIFLAGENVDSVYTHDHLCSLIAFIFWYTKNYDLARAWVDAVIEGTTLSGLVRTSLNRGISGGTRIPRSMARQYRTALTEQTEQARWGLVSDEPYAVI